VTAEPSALDLIRGRGLLADGPVAFGQPVRSRRSGIFLVELSHGLDAAPIESRSMAAWLAHVPALLLDGVRPSQAELTARLASFWLPNQRVVYVGRTSKSLSGRVAALYATDLGRRRPHSGGYWLKTLQSPESLRVWWADTDAPEEYEDAILTAFSAGVPIADRAALPVTDPLLPWAVLETATGERRATGITHAFLDPEETVTAASPTAKRAARSGTSRTGAATGRNSRSGTSTSRATSTGTRRSPAPKGGSSQMQEATHLTPEGLAALEVELDQLRTVRRPEVILRVKNARELGDLRENAEYQEARNEQSFLEGRIQALEQMLRSAVVIEGRHNGEVVLGSTVKVALGDDEMTFHIVGSTEADPVSGRISNASPVGRALLGHRAGQTVTAQLPGREVDYRILEVT
jgi:transcription elongation factor GreA